MTGVLIRGGKFGQREEVVKTHRNARCRGLERGAYKATRASKEPGTFLPPHLQKGHGPAYTWVSDFWTPELRD